MSFLKIHKPILIWAGTSIPMAVNRCVGVARASVGFESLLVPPWTQ